MTIELSSSKYNPKSPSYASGNFSTLIGGPSKKINDSKSGRSRIRNCEILPTVPPKVILRIPGPTTASLSIYETLAGTYISFKLPLLVMATEPKNVRLAGKTISVRE